MKKISVLFICVIILFILVGCNSKEHENQEISEGNNSVIESETNSDKSLANNGEKNHLEHNSIDSQKVSPIVTVEELPIEITILEPNSEGIRYMEATYKNNSSYKIQGMNVTILLKDKMENTYLSTYNLVLPGETSPKFETYAPETGKIEDYEYLVYEIAVVKEDGSIVHLTYDVREDTYRWF